MGQEHQQANSEVKQTVPRETKQEMLRRPPTAILKAIPHAPRRPQSAGWWRKSMRLTTIPQPIKEERMTNPQLNADTYITPAIE